MSIHRKIRNAVMAAIFAMAAIGAWAVMTERISYVVTDGVSMNPIYYQGDLVFVTKVNSYQVGQIAAYHGSSPGQRVLHRIIGGNDDAGFVMKGDNNESVDPLRPVADQMIGRAVLHVPKGGFWLKPLMGPSGLGMLSFLIVGGGAAATRSRRDIPRGRRKKKVKAMARQGGLLATAGAALKAIELLPPRLRAVAITIAALTGLAVALGILGWMQPTIETKRVAAGEGQSMIFSYSAVVPKSPAYDSTTVRSPEPIFRKLANRVDLTVRYRGPAGTFSLMAYLTNGTGWHTTMMLVSTRPFAGTTHDATSKLDLKALVDRADAASKAIGAASTGAVSVSLRAQVKSENRSAFSAPLQLQVDPLQMTVDSGTPLAVNNSTAAGTIVAAREIGIRGHSIMTAANARSWAILVLIAAGAGAALIFFISRRNTPLSTRAEIERRFPNLLVPVEPMPSPPGKPVVNVDNFPALVKLAERYGQMILTWRRTDADDFVVRDEGITYRYRIPLEGDGPTLQNIEHKDPLNRDGTGSHRRKASTPVS